MEDFFLFDEIGIDKFSILSNKFSSKKYTTIDTINSKNGDKVPIYFSNSPVTFLKISPMSFYSDGVSDSQVSYLDKFFFLPKLKYGISEIPDYLIFSSLVTGDKKLRSSSYHTYFFDQNWGYNNLRKVKTSNQNDCLSVMFKSRDTYSNLRSRLKLNNFLTKANIFILDKDEQFDYSFSTRPSTIHYDLTFSYIGRKVEEYVDVKNGKMENAIGKMFIDLANSSTNYKRSYSDILKLDSNVELSKNISSKRKWAQMNRNFFSKIEMSGFFPLYIVFGCKRLDSSLGQIEYNCSKVVEAVDSGICNYTYDKSIIGQTKYSDIDYFENGKIREIKLIPQILPITYRYYYPDNNTMIRLITMVRDSNNTNKTTQWNELNFREVDSLYKDRKFDTFFRNKYITDIAELKKKANSKLFLFREYYFNKIAIIKYLVTINPSQFALEDIVTCSIVRKKSPFYFAVYHYPIKSIIINRFSDEIINTESHSNYDWKYEFFQK